MILVSKRWPNDRKVESALRRSTMLGIIYWNRPSKSESEIIVGVHITGPSPGLI
jgi:hypothetical protein